MVIDLKLIRSRLENERKRSLEVLEQTTSQRLRLLRKGVMGALLANERKRRHRALNWKNGWPWKSRLRKTLLMSNVL